MATYVSRAERSGNIFFRVTGLIRSGQLPWAERPLWYDVYVSKPPISPPDWNVRMPKHDEPVRSIFYPEDNIRAKFYKKYRSAGIMSIVGQQDSLSQQFINEYNLVAKEQPMLSEEELFTQTEQRMEEAGVVLKNTQKTQHSRV